MAAIMCSLKLIYTIYVLNKNSPQQKELFNWDRLIQSCVPVKEDW